MATRFKISEMPIEHYENQPIKAQRFLKQDDNQETYEEVDDENYGNDLQTLEEEDSQETYEEIDTCISSKHTRPGNAYTVFGKGTTSSDTTTSAVQKTSPKQLQRESTVADIIAQVLPQRISSDRKWKIVSIVTFIIIITLICALITVSIMLTTRKVLPCDKFECLHSGTCSSTRNKAICLCKTGYHGDRCQHDLCTGSCLNNGTCSSFGDRYNCSCEVGYHGDRCENYLCDGSPCLNNGTCSSFDDQYNCYCAVGYHGDRCQNSELFVQKIMSPGFPSKYQNSFSRVWTIDVGYEYFAVFRFVSIDTESCCDFIYVYDGDSASSKLLKKYSGHIEPEDVRTTGRYLTIQFTTDPSGTYKGFLANISKVKI